ncbi:MAG: HAD family hydrolase [Candidatus Hodarchaeales archaeon]|jgi:HAD superfamily hydrolase (TIGR01509 family)
MRQLELSSIRVLSIDLFDTLVRVRGFDPRYAFEKCHAVLIDSGVYIAFEPFYNAYRKKIRQYLIQREKTGNDFTNDHLMIELLKDLGHPIELKLARSIVKVYFQALLPYTIPYPNLEPTIRILKDDFDLILTSNHSWPKHGYKVLDRVGIKSYFRRIIFSGNIGKAKPHPEIFEEAVQDINKDEILHVGDNPIADVDGAQRCGLKALWVHSREHFRNRRLVIPTLEDKFVGEIREIAELPVFLGIWMEEF